MLHSVFSSFYVDYFVRRQQSASTADLVPLASNHTSSSSSPPSAAGGISNLSMFIIGQLVYALWNGLNDLGFGWFGDTVYRKVDRRRLNRILVGGPLWALCFACLWAPGVLHFWHLPSAVCFTLLMILYDGFFSFTTVAFRAWLADITVDARDRERCNVFAAVAHVLGSVGVGFASLWYESKNGLSTFRIFTTAWAAVAAVGFVGATYGAREVRWVAHDVTAATSEEFVDNNSNNTATSNVSSPIVKSVLWFAKESLQRRSLWVVSVVWAVQEYSCTFATNFFPLFLSLSCGDVLSVEFRSFLLLMSFVTPHLITVATAPLLASLGKKKLISIFFGLRAVVGGLCLLLLIPLNVRTRALDLEWVAWAFAAFLCVNRILTEAVCRLQGLVLADVTDEDTVVSHRHASRAATVGGFVSLIAKPFQSIAPIVVVCILNSTGLLFDAGGGGGGVAADRAAAANSAGGSSSSLDAAYRHTMIVLVQLLGWTAVLTSGVMWVTWHRWYPLDGAYLLKIQEAVSQRCAKYRRGLAV